MYNSLKVFSVFFPALFALTTITVSARPSSAQTPCGTTPVLPQGIENLSPETQAEVRQEYEKAVISFTECQTKLQRINTEKVESQIIAPSTGNIPEKDKRPTGTAKIGKPDPEFQTIQSRLRVHEGLDNITEAIVNDIYNYYKKNCGKFKGGIVVYSAGTLDLILKYQILDAQILSFIQRYDELGIDDQKSGIEGLGLETINLTPLGIPAAIAEQFLNFVSLFATDDEIFVEEDYKPDSRAIVSSLARDLNDIQVNDVFACNPSTETKLSSTEAETSNDVPTPINGSVANGTNSAPPISQPISSGESPVSEPFNPSGGNIRPLEVFDLANSFSPDSFQDQTLQSILGDDLTRLLAYVASAEQEVAKNPSNTTLNKLNEEVTPFLSGLFDNTPGDSGQQASPPVATIIQGVELSRLLADGAKPLLVNLETAGGMSRTRQSLLNSIFTGKRFGFAGGLAVSYRLLSDKGGIMLSDVYYYESGFRSGRQRNTNSN